MSRPEKMPPAGERTTKQSLAVRKVEDAYEDLLMALDDLCDYRTLDQAVVLQAVRDYDDNLYDTWVEWLTDNGDLETDDDGEADERPFAVDDEVWVPWIIAGIMGQNSGTVTEVSPLGIEGEKHGTKYVRVKVKYLDGARLELEHRLYPASVVKHISAD